MDSSAHTTLTAAPTAFQMAGAAIAPLDCAGDGGRVDAGRTAAGRLCGRVRGGPLRRLPAGGCRGPGESISVLGAGQCPLPLVRLHHAPPLRRPRHRRTPVDAGAAAAQSLPAVPHLPSRLPVGVVIRDTQLRCTWANDTQGIKESWSRASIRPSVQRASTLCSGTSRVTDSKGTRPTPLHLRQSHPPEGPVATHPR